MKTPDVWITVGKRGFNDDNLNRLKRYNIDGFRINTGRSTMDWAYEIIGKLVKKGYLPEQIMLDIGNKKNRIKLNKTNTIDLCASDVITIAKEYTEKTDAWLNNSSFFEILRKEDTVYFGDGEMEFSVVEITNSRVRLRALGDGILTNNITIGIVGKDMSCFHIDLEEIEEVNKLLSVFPVCLILSFVENSDNISWARETFPKAHNIIPKIETASAIKNYASILEVSTKVFIGRGDLGLSIGIEKIGIVQKQLIKQAHEVGCYVATGTGILDSLKWGQVPLRAEIVDITNLCYESVDAIVLTSETGGSTNPFKAIDYLVRTLGVVEQNA